MDGASKRADKLRAKGKDVDFAALLNMEPDAGTTNVRNVASAQRKRLVRPGKPLRGAGDIVLRVRADAGSGHDQEAIALVCDRRQRAAVCLCWDMDTLDWLSHLSPIRLADFVCRRLVCATNAQLVAEKHLIRTFWPIWNSETKACWGMSKHGDAATTRANKRSPWDVVHPGRLWALDERLADSLTPDEIAQRIGATLERVPARLDHAALLEEMLAGFRQDDPVTAAPVIPPVGENLTGPENDELAVSKTNETDAARSAQMSRIRERDTKPEMRVRQALHSAGLRYRLHAKNLPGNLTLFSGVGR